MSSNKCKKCGGSDIDTDPARGDAVCTTCGSVLEYNIIVSSIQFEDNAHGGSSAIGQFVSSDSKGGARGFGGSIRAGLGVESREITIRKAKTRITDMARRLSLKNHHIDSALMFFKMALGRHLTRGRKTEIVVAACIYIVCRVERLSHLLFDFVDVMDSATMCDLGRTYLKLTQALGIQLPEVDPCIYIVRFAHQLNFAEKTNDVATTALKIVERMKKDSIHTGRRPAGVCGAALILAARWHEFRLTVPEMVKIVKTHSTTIQKRLMEFANTPSSMLSLDEFKAVDLEQGMDPPSYRTPRNKDPNGRIDPQIQMKLEGEQLDKAFSSLQTQIEDMLNKNSLKSKCEASKAEVIQNENEMEDLNICIFSMKRLAVVSDLMKNTTSKNDIDAEPSIIDYDNFWDGLDDEELSSYIFSEKEAAAKREDWNLKMEPYLQEEEEKEERMAREREEGQPEKKRKKYSTKKTKNTASANTPGESFEKMLKERKMSSKINYEVLADLQSLTRQKESVDQFGSVFESKKPSTSDNVNVKNEAAVKDAEPLAPEMPEEDNEKDDDYDMEEECLEEADPEAENTKMWFKEFMEFRGDEDETDEYFGEEC